MKSEPTTLKCLLCDGGAFDRLWSKKAWHYMRCRECSLVHLYPQPTAVQAADLYEDYLSPDPGAADQWSKMVRPLVERSADLITSKIAGRAGRVLDIGCGYGFFLAEMAKRGWAVQGIEISPAGRRYAREKLGIAVSNRAVASLQRPGNEFDVITLFYVIEHLVDPADMLQSVFHLLKPGGLVLLRWPHTTPIVRLLGPFARKLDLYHTPYHLYDFSPRTMKMLLSQCGFCGIRTTTGGYTLPANRFSRIASVCFGKLGDCLEKASVGRMLLPGVSKTTLAFKPLT